ncbi:MAG: Gfo/Idh/MocA family oxidoreductase [Hyphomicrobiaceae bacterium]
MNLFTKLKARAESGQPLRIGMIGAGKFGSMFLAQALRIPGVHLVGVVDLNPSAARSNMALVGWPEDRYAAASLDDAAKSGKTFVGDDWRKLVSHPGIDIVIECTGHPPAAVEHCLGAFREGKNVINVTVEADAFCGPGLAQKAREAGVIYSMAYGDQPALTCDLVDWARTCGFIVAAAGRGHTWLPHYRTSTPETVWDHWGLTKEQAERGRLNPKMFNVPSTAPSPPSNPQPSPMPPASIVPTDGPFLPAGLRRRHPEPHARAVSAAARS